MNSTVNGFDHAPRLPPAHECARCGWQGDNVNISEHKEVDEMGQVRRYWCGSCPKCHAPARRNRRLP